MKYILVLIGVLIIIFTVLLVQKQSDSSNNAYETTKTEVTANITALIKQLKPLVNEVSLKHFQSDDEVYSQYKDKLLMIDLNQQNSKYYY